MEEKMKVDKNFGQLGLLPMELAETNENGRASDVLQKCFYPLVKRIIMAFALFTFIAITYILLLTLLQSEFTNTTEIIVITPEKTTSNITVRRNNMDIFFQIKNTTSVTRPKRKKRSIALKIEPTTIGKETGHILEKISEDVYNKAKNIITSHDISCNERNHKEICKDLVLKLKSVIDKDDTKPQIENNRKNSPLKVKGLHTKGDHSKIEVVTKASSTNLSKRHTEENLKSTPDMHLGAHNAAHEHVHLPYHSPQLFPNAPKLSDTCLIAHLLKQHYPHLHEIYDVPVVPDVESNYNPDVQSNGRFTHFQYAETREVEARRRKVHPQDAEIFMSFLTPKPDVTPTNSSSRDMDCPKGTFACAGIEECIAEKRWCDGRVDCFDASDETKCSCKHRVDKHRLCDGYFDCPSGEDEMGCHGCSKDTFSCGDENSHLQNTCYSFEQKCNNIVDCPNRRDETDCNMLAPSLEEKSLFAISNTNGYLHRNFKGQWYPVCMNPYMMAHDACRRETGLVIRAPHIKMVQIDPTLKLRYMNTEQGGVIHISDSCFNSSAVYVTCPDLICGTRSLTKSQLLHEDTDSENHLFGRNKRFLLNSRPYPLMFYGRVRRQTNETGTEINRDRRAESRVVGGKPSQPADWPWMAAMYMDGYFHCGGVILTERWILSAAHCVDKFWNHYYEIRVGMLRQRSFSPQEQNHRVSHIIINQNYDKLDMKNDLSLLRVKSVIQYSRWVRPICLPGPATAGPDWVWGPPAGTMCTAVGWGAIYERGPDPDHIREVEVPIWEKCVHREDQVGREICAGFSEGGKDTCQGDSGGPLLCKNPLNSRQWYMAGIVSHGDGCAEKGEPGVYTRVGLFVDWIRHHILSNSLPGIQPKQECPGFTCTSGILKCLSKKKMCDGIIDCLYGEDEVDCEEMRSAQTTNDEFMVNETDVDEASKIRIMNSKQSKTELFTLVTSTPTDLLSTPEIPMVKLTTTSQKFINNLTRFTKLTNKTGDDSTTESKELTSQDSKNETTETSNRSVSSEDSESKESSSENTTVTTESTETSTDNEDFITITSTVDPLESRSSLNELEEQSQVKETDIEENWFDTLPNDSIQLTSEGTTVHTNDNHDQIAIADETVSNFVTEKIQTTPTIFDLTLNLNANKSLIDDDVEVVDKLQDSKTTDVQLVNNLQESESTIIEKPILKPATVRKQNNLPDEYQCRRIQQTIPYSLRCDRKADCEDGTDELGCTCIDYLITFDKKVICDGIYDCADGQDEIDCFGCSDDQILCKKSQLCLPSKHICDGTPQCPQGEDEFDCYALSNGKTIKFDVQGRPQVNLEGYLTKKVESKWHVICEEILTVDQQKNAANHICRYLGFSSAIGQVVKYINIKENDTLKQENIRNRREVHSETPIQFMYRQTSEGSLKQHVIIEDPHVIKEECVPNITKTCMSLYVFCDHSLLDNFEFMQHLIESRETHNSWPWIAKIYSEGDYKCSGILLDVTWVLVSHSCLWDTLLSQNHVTVVLGSQRTLTTTKGMHEQIYQVDAKRELYSSRAILLHFKEPAKYSSMVKPMVIPFIDYPEENDICVAIGQDETNNTVSVFLNETNDNCPSYNRCFVRLSKTALCDTQMVSHRQWSGLISCHSKKGWHPAASFVDSRGECGVGDIIQASDITRTVNEIRDYIGKPFKAPTPEDITCDGVRCARGRCVSLPHICDGVRLCEDGADESEQACEKKQLTCSSDPYHAGCDCSSGQLKCMNGRCIAKELFKNGQDDCGDSTDELGQTLCFDYITRVTPSRLCDGIIHCHDRSDEDPIYCKCFAPKYFKCYRSNGRSEHCVSPDVVCDGIRDCPGGEDEEKCIALSAPDGTAPGTGQVIIRSHGIWHPKCFSKENHTKTELEAICRDSGFLSGHAKQLKAPETFNKKTKVIVDNFTDVILNSNTRIKLRNTDSPLAKTVIDDGTSNCFPVFIECL